jgi:hypothetical protein
MNYATHVRHALGSVIAATMLGALSSPAFAEGTDANVLVTNAVTLNYQVNGFAQAPVNTSVDFRVDRALRVVVNTQNADVVPATPGQALNGGVPALVFDVSNKSNATVDLLLGVVDRDDAAVTGFTGNSTPAFQPTTVGLFLDDGGTPGQVDGTNTPLTVQGNHWILANVAEEVVTRILVSVTVPAAAANGTQATYSLVAAVANAGLGTLIAGDSNGRNAPGASGATSVVDDPLVVQNVFADIATSSAEDFVYNFVADAAGAAQDQLSNGQHSDSSAFVVDAAELYIAKAVEVLWDPINLNKYAAANSNSTTGNNPKAIPGAVVMYAIGVRNDTGSQPVTAVNISDDIAETVTEGTAAAVNLPDTVDVTLNGSPVTLDIPNASAVGGVNIAQCDGTFVSASFVADPAPEVSGSLGNCAADQNGLIVYLVTIPATP